MNTINHLFTKQNISQISEYVEEKMPILNNIQEFKRTDEMLSNLEESFNQSLTNKQKADFKNLMKLSYKLDNYYFTLSYFLGKGKKL